MKRKRKIPEYYKVFTSFEGISEFINSKLAELKNICVKECSAYRYKNDFILYFVDNVVKICSVDNEFEEVTNTVEDAKLICDRYLEESKKSVESSTSIESTYTNKSNSILKKIQNRLVDYLNSRFKSRFYISEIEYDPESETLYICTESLGGYIYDYEAYLDDDKLYDKKYIKKVEDEIIEAFEYAYEEVYDLYRV